MNGIDKADRKSYGKESGVVFRWSGVALARFTIPLPTVAFVACVLISLYKDFERSTATHCRVPNYLPSISAAIGAYSPQVYIWRICIALHCTPRLMVAVMYYNYFMAFPVYSRTSLYSLLCGVNSCLHIMENACLIGLSYVSSTENYQIHEKSFILFMVFSQMYMLLTIILSVWARKSTGWTARDRRSFRWKVTLFIANVSFFMLAGYLFYRHNRYCEPGVYTIFALCEYFTILCNMGYNSTWFLLEFGETDTIVYMNPQTQIPGYVRPEKKVLREGWHRVDGAEPHPWHPVANYKLN